MHENCIGCLSLRIESSTNKCGALGARFHNCPCKECLVKNMCQNRCQDLEDFENELYYKMPTVKHIIDKRWIEESKRL